MRQYIVMTVTALALAACGGGGSGGGSGATPPATQSFDRVSGIRTNTTLRSADYDPMADTYTVQRIGAPAAVVTGNPTFDIGTFDGADDGMGTGVLQSATDESRVSLIIYPGSTTTTGVVSERLVETTIPVTGGVSLTGNYVGILSNNVDGDVDYLISGNANATFDFANLTVEGMITDRVLRDPSTNTELPGSVADVMLFLSTLGDSGSGSGVATGGNLDSTPAIGAPTTTTDASYSLYIVGATGDQAVGGLSMTHVPVGGGDQRSEVGAIAMGH